MRTLFTSFGISGKRSQSLSDPFFARLPPAQFSASMGQFVPDFAPILLSTTLLVDAETVEQLNFRGSRHEAVFSQYREMIEILIGEGIVDTEDYSAIISDKQQELQEQIQLDVSRCHHFEDALRISAQDWLGHLEMFRDQLLSDRINHARLGDDPLRREETEVYLAQNMHVLANKVSMQKTRSELLQVASASNMRKELVYQKLMHREAAEEGPSPELVPYLEYTNSNLLLSEQLQAAIFDWSDLQPFYRTKMRLHHNSIKEEMAPTALKDLFKITFPHVEDWPFSNLHQMLKDKRISSLREVINTAVENREAVDHDFVLRKLGEVISIEREVARKSRTISYLTTPISFVPVFGSFIQKPIEEVASRVIAKSERKKIEWYFLVSEQADKIAKQSKSKLE